MKNVLKMSVLSLVMLVGAAAHAQVPPAAPPPAAEPPPAAPPPGEGDPVPAPAPVVTSDVPVVSTPAEGYTQRPLTNAAGRVTINGNVDINLSKSSVAKPIWVTPNIYYGVNDQLTLGLTHGAWEDIFHGGRGICLGGTDRGCFKLYNNVSLDALYSLLRQSNFDLAAHFGFDFRDIDAKTLGVHVGAALKFLSGPLAIIADPSLGIGINKRDIGNKEYLTVPVRIAYQASPLVAAFLDTGIGGPTSGFSDSYDIPVGVGALYVASPIIDVGAKFEFTNLAGKGHSADGRDLMLLFRIHP